MIYHACAVGSCRVTCSLAPRPTRGRSGDVITSPESLGRSRARVISLGTRERSAVNPPLTSLVPRPIALTGYWLAEVSSFVRKVIFPLNQKFW